ncbi:hypothetical protein OUZ56_026097 [Daphnia magna]|uniref:Uncharacterized protein n=1 Tax=Daphnia magna TaxID=35525 RepID=A0ABQ9ZKU8_9CRUS|nr:hypothetical protein OUZ56_026097 [Daphnia magna]
MSMDFATLAGCQRTKKPVYGRPEGKSNVVIQTMNLLHDGDAPAFFTDQMLVLTRAGVRCEGSLENGNGNLLPGPRPQQSEVRVVDRDQGLRTRQAEFNDREWLIPQVSVSSVKDSIDTQDVSAEAKTFGGKSQWSGGSRTTKIHSECRGWLPETE